MSDKEFEGDAGAPLPDFSNASNIQLQTIAPTLGVPRGQHHAQPDYLDYDQKRSIATIMFANCGAAYMIGTAGGGLYGFRQGLISTPSTRFKIKLNSVLNHCGRYGSRVGNSFGTFAIMYSLYEGFADHYDIEEKLMLHRVGNPTLEKMASPAFAAYMTGVTYFAPSGPRVAALAGTIGFGMVGATSFAYYLLGFPPGYQNFLFF